VDGFRLAYDRAGSGPPVVALHGWPGSRRDYRAVAARLGGEVDLVVPDLRGFGASDRHDAAPEAYAAAGQAASILGLIDEPALERPVLVGYDVGRRDAVATYLRHFWEHCSGPGWSPAPDEVAGAIRAATGTSA
jgi:pimeloyl-ACP methyl ester carboxylesterase